MKSSNVISFGEALIDRLGPLGQDPGVDKPVLDCFGGAPANVACALGRLGANVSFIGSLGSDDFGANFKQVMIDRGINIDGLQKDMIRPTRIVMVRRDAFGERSFGGFEGDKGLGYADQAIFQQKIIKAWPAISEKAKWLIVGTIPLASEISSKTYLWCIKKSYESGINIALDLNWRPTFWEDEFSEGLKPTSKAIKKVKFILQYISLIKLAKEEAQWFFNSLDPEEISSTLSQKPSVIITDASNPISWIINNNIGMTSAISPSSIVDTTGAGDAFTAGLIYKFLSLKIDQVNRFTAEEIIRFAIACGAYVCQGIGAIDSQPYPDDVENLLSLTSG